MASHTAPRRYCAPQLVDRGRIIEQTLMSDRPFVPEKETNILTAGNSI
jgi:hypothetical protein